MTKERDENAPRRRHPALNVQVPFFRPLWRRVLTVAVIAFWAGIEVLHGSPYWAMLAAGIGLYVGYQFFVSFAPEDES